MTTTGGHSSAAAGAGGPRPAPQPSHQSESVKEKKDLASWWKTFKRGDKKPQEQASPNGIFGVPLNESIRYANVAISLFDDENRSYIYGYVPIVVAKCGIFLKEKATDVEGIFRLAGSEKRIKELKIAFDSGDRYGKGLDWNGYTVHDAANILRRYFNQLPEPIIPLEFYQRFRQPLKGHEAQAVGLMESQTPSQGDFDQEAAIKIYQRLITELPPLNRQLLLYILDLLAVFASKSEMNKMTTPNLAAIFQPGILNHPQHDMAPHEYRLSQSVLIFLIENQDSFLIGMQGTAADEATVRDVQSGSPNRAPGTPPTPNRSKTVITRSGSNSSAAAESIRRFGSLRRNASVNSKHSKRSEGTIVPGSPVANSASGVHRSNTVPSRRGGSLTQSPRFSREQSSDPSTPKAPSTNRTSVEAVAQRPLTAERPSSLQSTPVATVAPQFPAPPEVTSASSSEATTPLATIGSDGSSAVARDIQTPKKDTIPLLAPSDHTGRSSDRAASHGSSVAGPRKGFLDILKQSPTSDGEGRKPNKLQKRRIPGSAISSAHSSDHDLPQERQETPRSPVSPTAVAVAAAVFANERADDRAREAAAERSSRNIAPNLPTLQSTPQRNPTDATLRPTISPSNSFRSHTDTSDADMVGDDMPSQPGEGTEKKKKSRWRISRSQNNCPPQPSPGGPLGTLTTKDQAMSRSTIGSSGASQPRQSFQEPTPTGVVTSDPIQGVPAQSIQSSATSDTVFSDSERERKGPVSWLRSKIQERKDKDAEKRSQTPERGHERNKSRQELPLPGSDPAVGRGRSFEQPRVASGGSNAAVGATPTASGVPPDNVRTVAPAATNGDGPTASDAQANATGAYRA